MVNTHPNSIVVLVIVVVVVVASGRCLFVH